MVRGITNFVQQNDLFRQHKLQNTYIVIDGKNICFQLYLKHSAGQQFFGGDYDCYSHYVTTFFEALLKCNVTPIVVYDGNNEEKKHASNIERYSTRIVAAANYFPALAGPGNSAVYPLFIRTVFTDVINKLKILVYRCEFAADNDIANLARELNCFVLSQDSDYFIYDVQYVPFDSLVLTPVKSDSSNDYYLNCRLYSCKFFLNNFPGLRWEHMIILATISGNDCIESDVFEKFYQKLGHKKGRAARMRNVVNYLRNKPFETAIKGIMDSFQSRDTKHVALKMAEHMIGYQYKPSAIVTVLEVKNSNCNSDSLKHDICATIDSLVSTSFKQYYSVDIVEQDRLDRQLTVLNNTIQKLEIANNKMIPEWFLRKNHTCFYPAPVFEISFSLMYFFPAVLENPTSAYIHSISFTVISAMNKIMSETLKGKEVPLKSVGRLNNTSAIRNFDVDIYLKSIISLHEIPNLTTDEKLDVLLDVLNFTGEKEAILLLFKEIPSDWHLLFLCVLYWKQNAKSEQITDAHVCSILLSVIMFKIIDNKIGMIRNLNDVTTKFAHVLKLKSTDNTLSIKSIKNYEDILKTLSEEECVFALSDLIDKFKFNDLIKFDKKVVHSFGELQSCIYYINALNTLLEEPVEKILIAECYNDTFLYNIYHDVSKQENMKIALETLLPHSIAASSACFYLYERQENVFKK